MSPCVFEYYLVSEQIVVILVTSDWFTTQTKISLAVLQLASSLALFEHDNGTGTRLCNYRRD
jgi:hypothetical protein